MNKSCFKIMNSSDVFNWSWFHRREGELQLIYSPLLYHILKGVALYVRDTKRNTQSSISLEEALKTIGLTEKEAQVYLSLLELGRGTVSAVARKAVINRTSGYHLLDGLTGKGLASVSGKEPKQE